MFTGIAGAAVIVLFLAIFLRLHKPALDGRLVLIVGSAFLTRIVVGAINLWYGPLPGAEVDARNFEHTGWHIARSLSEGHLVLAGWSQAYASVIGLLYWLTGRFAIDISALNALAVCVAVVNIYDALRLRGVELRWALGACLFLAVYPTAVLFQAIPVREALIFLGLSIIIRGLAETRKPYVPLAYIGGGIVILGTLNSGFLIVVPVLGLVPLLRSWRAGGDVRWRGVVKSVVCVGGILSVVLVGTISLRPPKLVGLLDRGSPGAPVGAVVQAIKRKPVTVGERSWTESLGFNESRAPWRTVESVPRAVAYFFLAPLPPMGSAGLGSGLGLLKTLDALIQILLLTMVGVCLVRGRLSWYFWAVIGLYATAAVVFGLASVDAGIAIRHRAALAVLAVVAVVEGARSRTGTLLASVHCQGEEEFGTSSWAKYR